MRFQESGLPAQLDAASDPQSADSSSSTSAPQQTEPDATEAQSSTVAEDQKGAANRDDREAGAGADTDPGVNQPQGIHQEFTDALHDLLMWVPAKDPQVAMLYASYEASQQRPASALK